MNLNTISPQELHDAAQAGEPLEVIDVRTPAEFEEVHVPFARNVPLDKLNASDLMAQRNGHDKPLYVICKSGNRAKQACDKLLAAGHGNVVNVTGGTAAWEQAGLPVVRGAKTMSLERQVRIAAGTLVLVGAALGFFVHPYWIGLAAFVGAGLVFAGITDTCGMGMMLAKMPWNQAPAARTSAAKSTNSAEASTCCRS